MTDDLAFDESHQRNDNVVSAFVQQLDEHRFVVSAERRRQH
jgi:hypothetical protein